MDEPSLATEPDALDQVITPARTGDRAFSLRVPPGWRQGRGAFGGLALGALARAISTVETDEARALRSLTAELAGPLLEGSAEIEVAPLRLGSGVSTWTATLTQRGELLAHATAVLGKARASTRRLAPAPPIEARERAWSELPIAPMVPPFAPEFAQHLEFRIVGAIPFTGVVDPIASGWVRARRRTRAIEAADLVALADAWYPATLAMEAAPRPLGTIAFTFQALATAPIVSEAPLFHRARVVAERDGYVIEQRELWTEDGELAALNQQTIVLIK